MPITGERLMSIRFFLQIGWRRSISIGDISTLRGVPLTGDSHWSKYVAVPHLQILQPMGNKPCLFLAYKINKALKKLQNHSQPFL